MGELFYLLENLSDEELDCILKLCINSKNNYVNSAYTSCNESLLYYMFWVYK